MKIIKKNVYYCEYCKKHSLSSYSMKLHEKHCTKNNNRKCRLCKHNGIKTPNFKGLLHIDKKCSWRTNIKIDKIQFLKKFNYCPICAFAYLRKINFKIELYYNNSICEFDLKKEIKNYYNKKDYNIPEDYV